MRVTAKYVNPPKPGKKSGSIKTPDGQYYFFDPAKFGFVQGAAYEITIRESDMGGKTFAFVETSTPVSNGNGAAPTNAPAAPTGDRWYMPFVSNTVAHAISANLLTEPTQIKLWAAAAKQAAIELEQPTKVVAVDDDDIAY